ncbi:hypothetical protein H1C71_036032 [Ictidomys tridecemlineatus]|nr:hypothetical protein H1C71_036032 [Ictidomys tridecemlineatus]
MSLCSEGSGGQEGRAEPGGRAEVHCRQLLSQSSWGQLVAGLRHWAVVLYTSNVLCPVPPSDSLSLSLHVHTICPSLDHCFSFLGLFLGTASFPSFPFLSLWHQIGPFIIIIIIVFFCGSENGTWEHSAYELHPYSLFKIFDFETGSC